MERKNTITRRKPVPWSWKNFILRPVKLIILAECAGLAGSYIFYRKINHDPEFRYFLYSSQYATLSNMLEGYYKIGEQLSADCQIRQLDQDNWKKEGKSV